MEMPRIDLIKTGERIRELRKQNNISVEQLRSILGFSTVQAIYKWERGLNLPTLDNLVVLAEIFHVSMDDIIVLERRKSK